MASLNWARHTMNITKPDNVLLLQGFERRAGQSYLILTVGYVVDADGSLVSEKDAWQWLAPQFADEPFDLGLQKRRGTFGVAGRAHAPGGKPVQRMAVQARFGPLEKTLHVIGNRVWQHGLTGWNPSEPEPFLNMPLDLAHAFGGPENAANPHGCGWVSAHADPAGMPLANIEWPDRPVMSIHDRPRVAGFGNLPASDPRQADWAGTFDAHWQARQLPWLPEDTDPRFFDRLDQDQCADAYWQGDERWSVAGMHLQQPLVEGRLPALQPQLLWLQGAAGPWAARPVALPQRAALALDTVWLFPESRRQALLYRAAIAVQREDAGDVEAVWIDTLPAGAQIPALNIQAARWAEQVPQMATRLMPAALAGTAAGMVATAASVVEAGQGHTNLSGEQPAVASGQSAPEIEGSSQDLNPDEDSPNSAAGLDVSLPEAEPAGAEAVAASTSARTDWADALWNEICAEYGAAWEEARQTVLEMEKEQAAYGVKFPEVAPFVAPPRPGMSAPDSMGLPVDFAASLIREVEDALAEGRQVFEAALRDACAEHPELIESVLVRVDSTQPPQIPTEAQMEEILSNLPPELRARAETEMQAMSAQFDQLEQELVRTFSPAGETAAGTVAAGPVQAMDGVADTATQDASETASAASEPLRAAATTASSQAPMLRGETLEGRDFSHATLAGGDFSGAVLTGCNFAGADLTGANFEGARIEDCDFSGARMGQVCLRDADITDTVFQAADWRLAQAQRVSLSTCDLTGVDATGADLSQAMLDRCMLHDTCLIEAVLETATLSGVLGVATDFSRSRAVGLRIDSDTRLEAASFRAADLSGCSFMQSHFERSDWDAASLHDGLLAGCDLSGSRAIGVRARQASFKDCRIQDADWRQADLMEATFDYAILQRVNLSGSNLHAVQTRLACVEGVRVEGALLGNSRLLQEHAHG
ncbi:hypothetical protein DD235_00995 [Corticimicrobacter populi]|uniref:DUF2169 domain-containing protein n=2 Tax=Corticimicrobacter populi TaxID=2175229 RepID=A0A2V1K5G3_9BURK|nr:hypothetical protein DD235_00995 [Corticimicrobacter populi]